MDESKIIDLWTMTQKTSMPYITGINTINNIQYFDGDIWKFELPYQKKKVRHSFHRKRKTTRHGKYAGIGKNGTKNYYPDWTWRV